jgi:hypothetical protein
MVTVVGTTRGAYDEIDTLECPGQGGNVYETGGPDVFYRLELGAAARLRVTPTASTRLLLSLHGSTCGGTGALSCGAGFGTATALDTLTQIPAGTYHLRVDHESSSFQPYVPGDFLLTAELLP